MCEANGGAGVLEVYKKYTKVHFSPTRTHRKPLIMRVYYKYTYWKSKGGRNMDTQRVTLILPTELVEIAEREAKKQRITRHNYLANILISNFGEVRKDPNAAKIKEIADLQRVNISILARMWGEKNENAAQIIREMIDRERGK